MATRGYTTGVPVYVDVADDGTVTYEVDLAELASAPWEDETPIVDGEWLPEGEDLDDEIRKQDAQLIQQFLDAQRTTDEEV